MTTIIQSDTTSEARIAKALAHPLRARILQRLGERVASPGDLAVELEAPLGVVSYHVRMLRQARIEAGAEPVGTTLAIQYPPTRRILVREVRRYWIAIKLDCEHVADVPTGDALISWRCQVCPPVTSHA